MLEIKIINFFIFLMLIVKKNQRFYTCNSFNLNPLDFIYTYNIYYAIDESALKFFKQKFNTHKKFNFFFNQTHHSKIKTQYN